MLRPPDDLALSTNYEWHGRCDTLAERFQDEKAKMINDDLTSLPSITQFLQTCMKSNALLARRGRTAIPNPPASTSQ